MLEKLDDLIECYDSMASVDFLGSAVVANLKELKNELLQPTAGRGGKLPVFLEGYDALGALLAWSQTGKEEERRHWNLRQFTAKSVIATLTWSLNGQCAGVDGAASTPEEAVYRAIQSFQRTQT